MNNQTNERIDRGTPMLTTYDNPFNPFTNFSEWLLFDDRNHHDCSGYVARSAFTSPALTDQENNQAIEDAIDDLIRSDILGIYRKVYASDFES